MVVRGTVNPAPARRASSSKLAFNGAKVFSATKYVDREALGEQVTAWLAERPQLEVVDLVVTQSSDAAFHCVAITVFYREPLARG